MSSRPFDRDEFLRKFSADVRTHLKPSLVFSAHHHRGSDWAELPPGGGALKHNNGEDGMINANQTYFSLLRYQVWLLSRFKVSCQLLTNDLDQVSSVSLLMTASTALANEGFFELTLVSLSFTETTEEPSIIQVENLNFDEI